MKNFITSSIRICCVGAICALASNASVAAVTDVATFTFAVGSSTTDPGLPPNEWNTEHGDIGIAFEGGELELHYHFEEGLNGVPPADPEGDEFEPNELYIRLPDASVVTAPAALPFLGITTGQNFWQLPQSGTDAEALGIPFVGLATEELDPLTFSSVDLLLTGFSGPAGGEFALWQNGNFGPEVAIQTNDGIGPDDGLTMGIGVHDHYNYGFSQPGIYQVTISATANAVPEPSSFAALVSLGMLGAIRRRRRAS